MVKKLLQRTYNGKPISKAEFYNRRAHKECMIYLKIYGGLSPSAIYIEQHTKDYTSEDEEEYYEHLRYESGDPVFR